MLVAKRDLKVFGGVVRKGDPIPFPEKWHPSSLQSNINMGFVEEVPDPVTVDTVKPEVVLSPQSEKVEAPKDPVKTLTCQWCGKDFKNNRALSVHKRSHRS